MTEQDDTSMGPGPITLIGLGPMGQAMGRKFLAGGHRVTVWNRTPARADELVAAGAARAVTPAAAVTASPLVILSLTDYAAMYDILGDLGEVLAGRVVVNLSSGTPQESRDAAAWLADRGAELVAGGIMVPAPMVGEEGAYVFYGGPRAAFEIHERTLRVIGRPDYRGEDPALGQLFYQAQLHVYLTTLASFVQAAALLGAAGVSAREYRPLAAEVIGLALTLLDEPVRGVDDGEHPGELSTAAMMSATADHIVSAVAAAGQDTALPAAIKSLYDRVLAAGHGKEAWTRMVDVIRNPRI